MLVYLIFGIILVVIPSIVPQSTFVLNESKHFKSSIKSTEEFLRFEESYENILTTNQKSDDETQDFKVDSTKRLSCTTSEIMTLIEPLTNASQNGSDLLKSMDQSELTNLEFLNKAFLIIVYTIVFIICVFGNILVVLSVFTYKPLHHVQNNFIVSLALADTFVAFFVIPFHITLHVTNGVWLFNSITCHFFLITDIFLCTSSILHLLCIALDRYWSIKDSIKYAQKRKRRVYAMIFLAWFSSAIISFPVLYWNTKTVGSRPVNKTLEHGQQIKPASYLESSQFTVNKTFSNLLNSRAFLSAEEPIVCDIPHDKLYRLYSSTGTFTLPLLIMTFVYIQIYLETKRRLHERSKHVAKLAKVMEKSSRKFPQKSQIKKASIRGYIQRLHSKKSINNSNKMHSENELVQNEKLAIVTDENEIQAEHLLNKQYKPVNIEDRPREPTEWKRNVTDNGNTLKNIQKISLSRERRTARTLGFIMGSFIFCWLPFFFVYLLQPFGIFEVTQNFFNYLTCLGYVNSALNPIIYTVFNIDFRKSFKRLLFECVLFKPRY